MAATESRRQLNNLFRYQLGASGFLECQETVNRVALERFTEMLSPAELRFELVVQDVLDMGQFATAAEIQVRENQKLEAIGLFYGPGHFSGIAVDFHNQSIQAAQRARTYLRDVREQIDDPSNAFFEAFGAEDTRAAFREARGYFGRSLAHFNIKREEFSEVLEIWDEVEAASGDAEGLFRYFDYQLEGFIARRQEPTRGNEPHSPFAWWKWFIIAAALCIIATAIAACYIYYECRGVDGIIYLGALAVTAIILSGC
jgi:hypothetical protein